MKNNLKKILISLGFLIIVFLIAWAIYYFFFKPAPKPAAPYAVSPAVITPGGLPRVTNENVNRNVIEEAYEGLPSIKRVPKGAVISEKAKGGYTLVNKQLDRGLAPKVNKDGSLVYYDKASGRFYKKNADGTLTLLSSQRFYSVSNVVWSSDTNKAVLEYPDGSNIVYDFTKQKQYTLPKEMQDFDFSQNGEMVAAEVISSQKESNWIVTSNPDGTNVRFIERIGGEADNVDVNVSPNSQVVALFRDNTGGDSQQVLLIGRNNENFNSISANGRGFEGQWTPNGQNILYSVFSAQNDFKPTLWIVGASGSNIGTNNINIGLNTWSNKCAVAADNTAAYCAVPQNLPSGSGWYPELANGSPDNFYRVDLTSGQTSLLAQPVGNETGYSATSLFLSPDEKTLYFQDNSGAVFSINL